MMPVQNKRNALPRETSPCKNQRSKEYAGMVALLRAACGRKSGAKASAAVDKIEEKRKPEDFIGHRKRGNWQTRWISVMPPQ